MGAAGTGAPQLRRQVARRVRCRDQIPPARSRPLGQRADAAAPDVAQRRGAGDAPAVVGPWLRRGRDADPAPHRRWGHGATLHHASQHVGHRPVSPGGAGVVPEATRRGRFRQGVRDRPQLSQRGHLAAPQSRVHDARAVSGLRRLQRHDGGLRGVGGRRRTRCPGHDRAVLRRPRARPHPAVATRHLVRVDRRSHRSLGHRAHPA